MKKIVFLLCLCVFIALEYSSSLPINNILSNWHIGFIIPSFDPRLPAVKVKYYELVLIITGIILLFVVIFRAFDRHPIESIKPWKGHHLPSNLPIGAIALLHSPFLTKNILLAIIVDMHQRNLLKFASFGTLTKGDKQANLPWELMLQNGNYSNLAAEIPEKIGHYLKTRGIFDHNPVTRWEKQQEQWLWLKQLSALFLIVGCAGVIGWEPMISIGFIIFIGSPIILLIVTLCYLFLVFIITWIAELFFTHEATDTISGIMSGLLLVFLFIFYFVLSYEDNDFFMQVFVVVYLLFFWLYALLSFPKQYQSDYLEKGKVEASHWHSFQHYLTNYYGYDIDFTKTPSFEQYLPYALAFNMIPGIDVSDADEWATVKLKQSDLVNSQWQNTQEMYNYLYAIGEMFAYEDNRLYISPPAG